jgi:hypothetical protein
MMPGSLSTVIEMPVPVLSKPPLATGVSQFSPAPLENTAITAPDRLFVVLVIVGSVSVSDTAIFQKMRTCIEPLSTPAAVVPDVYGPRLFQLWFMVGESE